MRPHRDLFKSLNRVVLVLTIGLLALPGGYRSAADQEKPPEPKQQNTLAKFITVVSPVEDGKITNTALKLQSEADRENRPAFLVLEITRGPGKFGPIRDLAKFLTSARLSKVRTVAWIPETVDGNKVILALACNEIVMHPDAELGDIGRGKPVDPDDKQFVLSLVDKRHNAKLSRALVLGMMDPQEAVWKLKVQTGDANESETRVVTQEEYKLLRDTKVVIEDVQTLKERGVIGTFSGRQARANDVLAVQTAETRGEVANLYNLPAEALRDDPVGETPKVALIKIDGMIEPVLETFLERQIDRALSDGVNLLIFEVDSPGGFLLSSTNLAHKIADLDPKKVRTVAYVPKMAMSGAAIISLGCDQIYLHPDAQIGDAGPIEMRKGGQFEHVEGKQLSFLRLTLKELANRKGRPPALTMAMADRNLKVYQVTHKETGRVWYMTEDEIHEANDVWIKGRLVPESEKDLFLTVDGQRAHELKMAEPPVRDLDDLKQRLDLPANKQLVAVERTWVDTLIFLLNTQAAMGLLFVMGVICIYLELHIVTGFFGILSAVCFSLLFWSRFLGGTAGWLEIVLFLLGLACIGMEIFVIPGFGVFGVSGGLLVFASLVLAGQTFGDYNTLDPHADINNLARTVGTLTASLVSVVVSAVILSRYLPHIPILSQMILSPPGTTEGHDPDEPQLLPEYADEPSSTALIEQDASLVGKQGKTVSVLRPAGKAQIEGRYLDVLSDGPYIPQGSRVEVVSVSGNRVVVRRVS